jgi:hypothetical protein
MSDDLLVLLRRAGDLLDGADAGAAAEVIRLDDARRSRLPRVAAVAASVLLVAGGIAWAGSRAEPATRVAQSPAERPEIAVAAPARVLPGIDGWRVVAVQQVTPPMGEVTFGNGAARVELRWGPGTTPDVAGPIITIAGYEGRISSYSDTDHVASWTDGTTVVVLRGSVRRAELEDLARSLGPVDAATWTAALPPGAHARGSDRVAQVLEGVPLAPGQTIEAIRAELPDVANDYQLTAEATGAVVCGWIRSWVGAADDATRAAAVAALDSSRSWASLQAIADDGGWSGVVWDYADAMAGRAEVPAGKAGVTVAESYEDAFGC